MYPPRIRGSERVKKGAARGPSHAAERVDGGMFNRQRDRPAGKSLTWRPWVIDGQLAGRAARKPAAPLSNAASYLRSANPIELPSRVIGVLRLRVGQRQRGARRVAAVQGRQLW